VRRSRTSTTGCSGASRYESLPFPVLEATALTASLEAVFTASVTAFAGVFVAVLTSPFASTASRTRFSFR
jgi:hypothetical protein